MTKEQADSIEILENTELDINTIYNVDLYTYNIAVKNVLYMLEEKDQIIDLMAEEFKEKTLMYSDFTKEEVKQYFENKAKEVK